MPHSALSRILRAAAPAAVRLIAIAAVVLGRPPHHTEAGVSKATWYRNRGQALALAGFSQSQNEKNQGDAQSQNENSPRVTHSAVDNSDSFSTGLAHSKPSGDHVLASLPPRKRYFSTGQKKKSTKQARRESSASAPSCRAPRAVGRQVLEALRRDWLAARQRYASLPPLTTSAEALAGLDARIARDGAERVLEVARASLAAAERCSIPGVYWARLFIGRGYEARAAALDLDRKSREDRERQLSAARRPLTEFERRLLRSASA